MMFAPTGIEKYETMMRRELRQRRIRRIAFDALGVLLVVVVFTAPW